MEKVAYQCKNVVASSHTSNNLSRHELLQWINDSLGHKVLKVESLCSGAEYCHFMNMLFPGCMSMKRIKFEATQEHEYITNLKQLQVAFRTVGCDKDVPIERLIKGRFQENFEFLQWFKRFFDANWDSKFSTPTKITTKQSDGMSKKAMSHASAISASSVMNSGSKQKQVEKDLKSQMSAEGSSGAKREASIAELDDKAEMLTKEKEFYYKKLRNIEILCNELGDGDPEEPQADGKTLVGKILAELYATEDECEPQAEEEETY